MSLDENIINGAKTAFINETFGSLVDLRPKLIVNNSGNKVLNSIKEELVSCDEFYISVAFITMGGLTPLLQDLAELETRGIKGKILTTDYLNFTEPESLKRLNNFSNIEIKLYKTDNEGFHTKGYIFKNGEIYKAIVGSSNLTLNALTVNKEWNIGFSSLDEGEILTDLVEEFYDLWNESYLIDDVIAEYENLYNYNKNFGKFNKEYNRLKIDVNTDELVPNSMQESFLENLRELIQNGEDRALLVSATGTGKTYAAAFAVKDFRPKKLLFLVHREQILKQAIKSFKRVFNNENIKFGLLSGTNKDFDADFLFATRQTMSKDEIYSKFEVDHFDYIIVDEVHNAGATSYLKILEYFKPKFLLGMTASPDRTDDFNIYEYFNYNIPLDIRLQDALDEDLLCPFHYFGIKDFTVDGELIDDDTEFNNLVSEERVDYLLRNSEYFGYSGNRPKALVFCSRKKEAKELAKEFTRRGHPSMFLSGDDSQSTREEAIERLTTDRTDYLEYIFTVDIFNEGVDIPEINQVLLVRPTQSAIVFIQQFGRGLRKFDNKEYVVIIDFIGNYKNNFLIPIALSGDRTYDKDNIRKYLMEGSKLIKGKSTINFDEVSKKRIYNAINETNFSKITLFKEKYQNLKYKLGRIPYLCDFYENGELDPSLILNHNSFDTYHNFLKKVEKDYNDELSGEEIRYLKFISDVFSDGKRPHELLILKLLIYNKFFTIEKLETCLKEYGIINDFKSIESSFNIFNLDFFVSKDQEKYSGIKFFNLDIPFNFVDNTNDGANNNFSKFNLNNRLDEKFIISDKFNQFLANPIFYKNINDLIDFALKKYENNYKFMDGHNLTLYAKYSRKDACRLLNWPHDDSSTMYGYRVKHNTCPIFVTYEKEEDISSSTKYQDEFISRDTFSWMTRSKVRLDSPEVKRILDEKTEIHIFIKHSDGEGKDFYYIGQAKPIDHHQTTIKDDKGKDLAIVNFKYKLEHQCKEDLYNYFMDSLE